MPSAPASFCSIENVTGQRKRQRQAQMNKINLRRVLLGGVVTGLILNLGEVVLNDVVLGPHIEADMKRMNITPPGAGFAVLAVTLTFVFGIVAILIYAMMRARLGPGPKTALLTALVLWF